MKKILLGLQVAAYSLLPTQVAYAQTNPGPAGKEQLVQLITRIINLSVEAAFLVLIIMLIYAGIKFLTSGGDPKAIGSASGTITWALLGILFLAIGWLILRLIESFTGVPVTKFCIGFEACS
jgi:hypothetical protein